MKFEFALKKTFSYADYMALVESLVSRNMTSGPNQSQKLTSRQELEQKVAERTIEIKAKNDELLLTNNKLQDLNQQINEMNAKLDYDNWHLKKDLKEDLKAAFSEI